MTQAPSDDNDIRQAVAILRGLKKRVDRLEERPTPEGPVNQIRVVNEASSSDDATTSRVSDATIAESVETTDSPGTTVRPAGSFTWNSSRWTFTEWAFPGATPYHDKAPESTSGVSASVSLTVFGGAGGRQNNETAGVEADTEKAVSKTFTA